MQNAERSLYNSSIVKVCVFIQFNHVILEKQFYVYLLLFFITQFYKIYNAILPVNTFVKSILFCVFILLITDFKNC